MVELSDLIETVREQGCVKLHNGKEGIPRKIEITPEYEIVDVDTDSGHYECQLEEIAEIILVG